MEVKTAEYGQNLQILWKEFQNFVCNFFEQNLLIFLQIFKRLVIFLKRGS